MKKYAPVFVILAGSMWGTMGFWVRSLNDMGLKSMEISELRCIVAAVLLFAVNALTDRRQLMIKPGHIWPLAGSGIFSILFFNYCYFSTITMMSLSMAAILLYTSPIFVMLMSLIIFREKMTVRKLAALVLAFAGCCLVCGIVNSSITITIPGLMLGLGSGFGYALYSIFSRFSINNGLKPLTITAYTFLFAAAGGAFLTDFSRYADIFTLYGIRFIVIIVIYSIVTTLLPYILYTTGLQYMENGPASVIVSVEPVVATLLGIVIFAETLSMSAVIGIVLVLAAVILLSRE